MNFLLSIAPFIEQGLREQIPEGLLGFLFLIAIFLLPLLVLTVILYLAGLVVVGGRRARFSDAFLIALLGTIINSICALFIPYFIILILVQIIVWLGLIKYFYETGWLGALAVAILSVIAFIIILVILFIIFVISFVLFEKLLPLIILSLL